MHCPQYKSFFTVNKVNRNVNKVNTRLHDYLFFLWITRHIYFDTHWLSLYCSSMLYNLYYNLLKIRDLDYAVFPDLVLLLACLYFRLVDLNAIKIIKKRKLAALYKWNVSCCFSLIVIDKALVVPPRVSWQSLKYEILFFFAFD